MEMLELKPKQTKTTTKKKKVIQMKFSSNGLIKGKRHGQKRINDLKLGQKKFTQQESQREKYLKKNESKSYRAISNSVHKGDGNLEEHRNRNEQKKHWKIK